MKQKGKLRRSVEWLIDLLYDLRWFVVGVVALIGLITTLVWLSHKIDDSQRAPAPIHVRCVGKYLVLENLESHDIEVAGPCSK